MMDIKNPEYFVTLAGQKNMRKASEILYLSQPTLSYYLNRLEHDVGCPLFYRQKNELELTPAGQLYLEAAQHTMQIRDALYMDIARLNRESHLFVLTGSMWANDVLGWVLPQLRAQFPNVQFETSMETARSESILNQPSLSTYAEDFCLCSYPNESVNRNYMEILYREPLFFSIPQSHPYCQTHPDAQTISTAELTACFGRDTLLISRPKSSLFEICKMLFAEQNAVFPEKICEINGLPITSKVLESGYGVSLLPLSVVKLSSPEKVRHLRIAPDRYRYHVLWHRSSLEYTPVQKCFMKLVREYYQQDQTLF